MRRNKNSLGFFVELDDDGHRLQRDDALYYAFVCMEGSISFLKVHSLVPSLRPVKHLLLMLMLVVSVMLVLFVSPVISVSSLSSFFPEFLSCLLKVK
ncbi:hypothetical protein Dimus_002653 [Dionaea muscipula]